MWPREASLALDLASASTLDPQAPATAAITSSGGSFCGRAMAVRERGGNLFPQNRVEALSSRVEGASLGDECIVEGAGSPVAPTVQDPEA